MLSNQQQRTETIPIKEEDLSIKSARAPELDAIEIDVVQKQRHLPISKSYCVMPKINFDCKKNKEEINAQSSLSKANTQNQERVCRICYDVDKTENKLISPCSCTGSCQYVHQECIKKWLTDVIEINNTRGKYVFPKCEICNSELYLKFFFKLVISTDLKKKQIKNIIKNLIILIIAFFTIGIIIYTILESFLKFGGKTGTIIKLVISGVALVLLVVVMILMNKNIKEKCCVKQLHNWQVMDTKEIQKMLEESKNEEKTYKNLFHREWYWSFIKNEKQIVILK